MRARCERVYLHEQREDLRRLGHKVEVRGHALVERPELVAWDLLQQVAIVERLEESGAALAPSAGVEERRLAQRGREGRVAALAEALAQRREVGRVEDDRPHRHHPVQKLVRRLIFVSDLDLGLRVRPAHERAERFVRGQGTDGDAATGAGGRAASLAAATPTATTTLAGVCETASGIGPANGHHAACDLPDGCWLRERVRRGRAGGRQLRGRRRRQGERLRWRWCREVSRVQRRSDAEDYTLLKAHHGYERPARRIRRHVAVVMHVQRVLAAGRARGGGRVVEVGLEETAEREGAGGGRER